jgi:dihydrofolate reductase
MLELIVAHSNNGIIGDNNKLLWNLKDDLKNFKNITENSTIVMGRKTYESIGRPLPNRKNIVLSRNKELKIEGCKVINSIDYIFKLSKNERIIIIGGEQIYKIFKNKADKLHLTVVDCEIEGDAKFSYSKEELQSYNKIKEMVQSKNKRNEYSWVYFMYEKK